MKKVIKVNPFYLRHLLLLFSIAILVLLGGTYERSLTKTPTQWLLVVVTLPIIGLLIGNYSNKLKQLLLRWLHAIWYLESSITGKAFVVLGLCTFAFYGFSQSNKINDGVSATSVYVDATVPASGDLQVQANDAAFHLFTHGKTGRLLIEGKWMDAPQISAWLQAQGYLSNKTQLNIYGCEFAKGAEGFAAVAYLEAVLGVSVAASDDVTGVDGDWELEVGHAQYNADATGYGYNLQCTQNEYIYMADANNNLIHKFRVNTNGSLTEIPNGGTNTNPWLPASSGIYNPHGLSIDPNGYLYTDALQGNSTPTGNNTLAKLDCDGNVIQLGVEAFGTTNHTIIGNYIYWIAGNSVRVNNLCDGMTSEIGYVNLTNNNPTSWADWGLVYNPNDGMIYVTDDFGNTGYGSSDVYAVNPADPSSPTSIWQTHANISPVVTGIAVAFGVTFDNANNMYVVEQQSWQGPSRVRKYSYSGGTWNNVANSAFDATNNASGYYNAWGITYSTVADKIYVTSRSEDCVAMFNPGTLAYEGAAVPHVAGQDAKAISRIMEGCYTGANPLNVSVCPNTSSPIYLRDLLDCPVCGGTWMRTSGTGGTFDACGQTFDPMGATNSSFTFSGSNSACGPFSVTVNLTIASLTVANTVTCSGGMGNINITPTGGAAPYTYLWSNNVVTEDLTNVPDGTYTVTVTDNTGVCSAIATIVVNCACPTITNPSAAQTICAGNAGNSLSVTTAATGTNAINFVRFTSQQTVAATIYAGTSIGMATPSGGTATLAYNWSSVSIGTYYVYAILSNDMGGTCQPFQEIVVTVTALPTISVGTPTCNVAYTQYNVTVTTTNANTLTSSAGTVSGSAPTFTVSGVPAGTTITLTARNTAATPNCVTTQNFTYNCCPTITNPSAAQSFCAGSAGSSLSASTTATGSNAINFVRFTSQQTVAATIYGGTSIGMATPAGGTATLAYNWSAVAPGVYYVYAILNPDPGSSCRPYVEIVVTVTAPPALTVTNGSICSGGSIDLATLVTSAGGGSLSYYATLADANAGTNPLASSTVSPTSAKHYYIRSQTIIAGGQACYTVLQVTVTMRAANCGNVAINGPN